MKSLEPKRLSRITPRDLCLTIARAKIIVGRKAMLGTSKTDKFSDTILTTADNIWLASGHNLDTLIKWYIMSLVKLAEKVPDKILANILDTVAPDKRGEYENILTSFNKALESRS